MKDHQPSAIPLYEDAGAEIRAAAEPAFFGWARGLVNSENPGNVAYHFDRGLLHEEVQLV